MSYLYENYLVNETKKSYVVTFQIPGDNAMKARISKELIENINSAEDSEMIAIVCAIVEFARFDAKIVGERAEETIITCKEFREGLQFKLGRYNIEDIITEIQDAKFFELKRFFIP